MDSDLRLEHRHNRELLPTDTSKLRSQHFIINLRLLPKSRVMVNLGTSIADS
jgi:hypothetical protein